MVTRKFLINRVYDLLLNFYLEKMLTVFMALLGKMFRIIMSWLTRGKDREINIM